ncbi:MAG: hypothetical protein LBF74_04330, partial [Treponema sp.]|nr:hypothetical protein [Treponema sp.]
KCLVFWEGMLVPIITEHYPKINRKCIKPVQSHKTPAELLQILCTLFACYLEIIIRDGACQQNFA